MIINQKHTDHHHQWCLYLFWILRSNIDLGRWGRWCFCIYQRRPDLRPFFQNSSNFMAPSTCSTCPPPSITRVSVRCLDFLNYSGKNVTWEHHLVFYWILGCCFCWFRSHFGLWGPGGPRVAAVGGLIQKLLHRKLRRRWHGGSYESVFRCHKMGRYELMVINSEWYMAFKSEWGI